MTLTSPKEWLSRSWATGIALALDALVVAFASAEDRVALVVLAVIATTLVAGTSALRSPALLLPGVFLLAGAYVTLDGLGQVPRVLVVPYALGLFLVAELGYESVRARPHPIDAGPDRARALYLAVVSLSSLVVSIALLVVSTSFSFGVIGELVGLAAGIGVFGWIGIIATRNPGRPVVVTVGPDQAVPSSRDEREA